MIFVEDVKAICQLYTRAQELAQANIHLVSIDEMTGIQALERKYRSHPMRPHQVELREFEYIRHGVQSLIANLEVASGHISTLSLAATRTEADFATHIRRTLESDPQAGWIFIVDRLNIHQSCSLVQLIAEQCQLWGELRVDHEVRIPNDMTLRRMFLSAPSHRIRFVYLPRHTSWLNQIEIWFSILTRRLLKRASFSSLEDLRQRILAFADYFNRTMAKPIRWSYKGNNLRNYTA